MEQKEKPVKINDARAIRLVKARALEENRSFANAATVTIMEHLAGIHIKDKRPYVKKNSVETSE